ncbi:MAG: ribosome biogenesis GTP-binding protein YihA/YsxC [Succinivibrio sp.]|jgi:GTP-binding protein|nr:ribosome biogenesis GTP-binding protein YihA/YsxC [Succinivibrio sp.]
MSDKELSFRNARFITSAPAIGKLPDDRGTEVAFIGRSNSGKSSALNAICDQKNLAKTSRTPGRTQLINLFKVSEGKYFVDLPGYGYAAVPESMKRKWQTSMTQYLQCRQALAGLVMTMDIRTPLRDHDRLIIDWSISARLPVLILLTKADKLGVNARREGVAEVRRLLSEFNGTFTIIAFSAIKKIGVDETRAVLRGWFAADEAAASAQETP